MTEDSDGHREGGTSLTRRSVLAGVSGIALGTALPTGSVSAQSLEAYDDELSAARLTPRPAETDLGGTESLNGAWEFALSSTEAPPTQSAGRVIPDQSSAGNDGAVGGDPAVVTRESERAVDLTGEGSVAVGDASGVDFTEPGFTVRTTFRYDGDGPIWSKGGEQYSLGVWGGELSFWMLGGGDWPGVGGGDLTQGRWYTTTLVVDDSEIRLYVDGQQVGSTTHQFAEFDSVDSPLHLGYDAGNDDYGAPTIDQFRAFDTALSAERIQQGFESVPNSAVAWLPLNTVSEGTTPDESSAGNDGTLRGAASLVPGREGEGLDLSGDGLVRVENADSLDRTELGFTIRATVRYGGGGGLVVDRGNSTGGTEQFGLGIYDGSVSFWAQTGAANWPTVQGGDLSAGEWYTITAVVGSGEVRLFVDDQQVGSVSHDADALVSSDAALVVGGNDLALSVTSVALLGSAASADRVARGFRGVPDSAVLWHNYGIVEDRSVEWGEADVPGQWAYDEYYVPAGSSDWYPPSGQLGWYRRSFEVPDGWADGRLLVRFDAVYSEAWVFVNGQRVGHHVGGYTPFEVDVSDAVDPDGPNTLAVGVSQASTADDMSWQNVTGGITRDVTLLSVPEAHLADVDVRTDLAEGGDAATVSVDAAVANHGDAAVEDATVSVTLSDPDGETVGSVERTLGSVAAGDSGTVEAAIDVSEPRPWNPEQPRLYTVDVTLSASGATERVSERVGIREVAVDGNKLRINGEAVTLRGVNWEEIHLPEHGQAIPEEITRADARRLKEANVNYVRTAHHPTSEAFLDACDELGIVVEVEAPIMFIGRDRTVDPDTAISQILEMVERDRNRASVCLWSIANESGWYDAFATAGALVNELDPTRPTIFNHDAYSESDPWHDEFDVRSHHYPAFRAGSTVDEHSNLDDPVLFDEYAHGYCYNDEELVTDPGLRDQWGIPFEQIWEACRDGDSVAGAAIWAGGDHLEQWGEYLWGVLDRNRRPRPEYYHVKKVYSPVRITNVSWDGTEATLTVENRHEFVNLARRPFELSGASRDELAVDLAPDETGTVTLSTTGDTLGITVRHPEGHAVDEFEFTPDDFASSIPTTPAGSSLSAADGALALSAESFSLTVDQESGSVRLDDTDGNPLLVDAPALVLTPIQQEAGRDYDTRIGHRLDGETVTDVSLAENGAAARLTVEYSVATGTFLVRPLQSGLAVEYDFTVTESVDAREVGVALPVADGLRTLSWERDGQWRTYPDDHVGRQSGTATAFDGGSRPENEGLDLRADQPWHADTTRHGSNDFRSTKRNVRSATLGDGSGRDITVTSDGSQHVRATVESGHVDLLVLDRSLSGTNARNWLNRLPVLDEEPTIAADERVQGSATLRVAEGTMSPIGDSDNPPADLDGDGRFEDVDGDGAFTLADVHHLFYNRDDSTVRENPAAFAFARREDPTAVTLADVQALYDKLQDRDE
jgi:hypothetical protein